MRSTMRGAAKGIAGHTLLVTSTSSSIAGMLKISLCKPASLQRGRLPWHVETVQKTKVPGRRAPRTLGSLEPLMW